jgi:hypothetical protein
MKIKHVKLSSKRSKLLSLQNRSWRDKMVGHMEQYVLATLENKSELTIGKNFTKRHEPTENINFRNERAWKIIRTRIYAFASNIVFQNMVWKLR